MDHGGGDGRAQLQETDSAAAGRTHNTREEIRYFGNDVRLKLTSWGKLTGAPSRNSHTRRPDRQHPREPVICVASPK